MAHPHDPLDQRTINLQPGRMAQRSETFRRRIFFHELSIATDFEYNNYISRIIEIIDDKTPLSLFPSEGKSLRFYFLGELKSALDEYARAADAERGFLDRFRQTRVTMTGAGDVFGGTAEFHHVDDFLDEITALRADDVAAETPVGLRVGQNFHEAVRIRVAACPRVGGERELARIVCDARFFKLFFGLADEATSGCV